MPGVQSTEGLIPVFTWTIDIPTRPGDLAKRHHNRIVKEAVRESVEKYHDKFVPMHFKQSNRQRYRHAPRSARYKKYKRRRYGGMTDMVLTGRTKRAMTTQYRLRVGGTAEKNNVTATLKMRFPFRGGGGNLRDGGGRNATRARATIKQMIREMQTLAADEPPQLAEWFLDSYMRRVEQFRSGRKRKRVAG